MTRRLPMSFRHIAVCGALIALVACGNGSSSTGPHDDGNPYGLTTTGPGVLSVTPLDTSTIFAITPLGQVSPPGHTLPTDHIYLSFVDPWNGQQQLNDCSPRPVRAAGSGVITFTYVTEPSGGDTKVDIQMTKTFHYYYDHVLLKPGMIPGKFINAGDTIATTTGRCPSIDLGAWDTDVTPPNFANPARYVGQSLHVVPPLKYFVEPLRSALYRRVRLFWGVPVDLDGRTDWGVKGRLAGDWFHSSLATADGNTSSGPTGWTKQLSFSHEYFARQPILSIGGTVSPALVTPVPASVGDPATIGVANGLVAFQTQAYNGNLQAGWILLQMTADDHLRVEFFAGATARPAGFTSAAQDYVR